jgi:predicted GH43/DUF377 family glycosyl hydrolase
MSYDGHLSKARLSSNVLNDIREIFDAEIIPYCFQGRTKVIASWSTTLNVERLNQGLPLISADPDGWDDGFTLNPTAIRLERSSKNDEIVKGMLGGNVLSDPRLISGVVAVFYRGIPDQKPGLPHLRSAVGLAIFTPEMELLKRFPYPVIVPNDDPMTCDYNGVEDQRITRIGDTFYMVYCGYNPCLSRKHNIRICMAESTDLIHWTKLGPVSGSVNSYPNKDAVILSEPIDGHYMMLHRPCIGNQGCLSIALAISDSPTGEWRDLGTIMRAIRHPRYSTSWVGAGSTPLSLGDKRFLADYHTGNYYPSGERDYFASYAVLNFNKFDIKRPEAIVESRCEGILLPETPYEINSPWPHKKNLNCVFPCGSYEYGSDIVLVYGGADAYVLAAKLNRHELLSRLEETGRLKKERSESLPHRLRTRASSTTKHYSHIYAKLTDDSHI